MQEITSANNPKLKSIAALQRGRERKKQNRIVIHGCREVGRALRSNLRSVELFVGAAFCETAEVTSLLSLADSKKADSYRVDDSLRSRMSYGERFDGVVAIADRPTTELDALSVADQTCIVILEALEKPGNIGAVFRTASAAGASSIILTEPRTDVFHANAIRASMGLVFQMPVACATNRDVARWLQQHRIATFASRVDASRAYSQVKFQSPSAILFGSEADGLSDDWRHDSVEPIRIPMVNETDSLNISVSAGIILYEVNRQWHTTTR